jgi:hypothetical protein
MLSNLPFGSGVVVISSAQAHLTRVGALSGRQQPYPASYPRRSAEGPTMVSRFPVAFRPPAFASRVILSRQGVGPSSRSAYRALGRVRTLTGFPRSTRTRDGRGGCLLYPEGGGAHPVDHKSSTGACRFPAASP